MAGCEVVDFIGGGPMSSSDDEEEEDTARVWLTGSASEAADSEAEELRGGWALEGGGRVGFVEGGLEVVELLDVLTGRGGLNAGRGFFAVSLGGMV